MFFKLFAASCQLENKEFFGIPTWYKYLRGTTDEIDPSKCTPIVDIIKNPNELWAIGLAILDLLLRVGGLVAVGFIMYGGFQYIISQGEPDKAAGAKNTILNALVGLVIAIVASAIVSYVGGAIK